MAPVAHTGVFWAKAIKLGGRLLPLSKMVCQRSLEKLLDKSFGKT